LKTETIGFARKVSKLSTSWNVEQQGSCIVV